MAEIPGLPGPHRARELGVAVGPLARLDREVDGDPQAA